MPATLHIDTGREMRGGQWQALYLARGLAAAGHRTTLLARSGAPLLESARRQGLDARPLAFGALMSLAPGFDLIHAHDARAHAMAAFRGGTRPLVVSRRVAFPPRRSLSTRWKYSRASRYIAVSEYVKRVLVESGVSAPIVDVVPDGVPLPPCPAPFENRSRVVALDSNDPAKGRAVIEQAAARAGVAVIFSNTLPADLESAALFLYITESEGLGSAALLAMAAGVPVLASAVGGLPEIVEDGITGALTSNSPEQIADNMLRLLGAPAALARMGRNARARVEEAFTTEHMLHNTLRVYEKAAAV